MSKTASQLDREGYFIGPTIADESPLEAGVFLIPGGAVDAEPPAVPDGQRARWTGNSFLLEDVPVVVPVVEEEPEPTQDEIIASLTAQIQSRLDAFAQTRNYDGILSACTYATSTVPKFASDGQYCVQARDATWAAGYALMDEVLAGTRPVPASIADIEADLPVLAWPA